MKILVTGSAGFIGAELSLRLLARGDEIAGVDNLNDYYDVRLKHARLERLKSLPEFHAHQIDIADRDALADVFSEFKPDRVINLAAQAGVRYSIDHPRSYVDTNLLGFANILENCQRLEVGHLVFASSSSVYGANTKMPFSTHDHVDHPLSLYAATKKSNELMAHSYSHLYGLPTTGLRFFTVYGPWGRPDMAYYIFADKILKGESIDVFNYGNCKRDFTYIDDIIDAVVKVIDKPAVPNPNWSGMEPDAPSSLAPYRIYNIGNNNPVDLLYFIEVLEKNLGCEAIKNLMPLQTGDVPETYANIEGLVADIGFSPSISIEQGLKNFVSWYKDYIGIY